MILKENYVRFRRELDDYRRETGRTEKGDDIDEW